MVKKIATFSLKEQNLDLLKKRSQETLVPMSAFLDQIIESTLGGKRGQKN